MTDDTFYKQPTLTDVNPDDEPPSAIPRHIGPYKIESLLNKGGMSLLYMGIQPETRQMLAIKVLSPTFVTHPEMVAQFLKESKIIGMTNHPNIVKLYGEGQWEGGLYIAMEFIRGVSLRQFIEQQSLSLKRCIDIILQVAYALCHLHSHGVIHGDLKPENILITEDGIVKVIDFGIARLHEEIKKERGKTLRIVGTPTYMSPEQKEDPSKISFASDIYALGIIAYELLSGKLSFGVIHLSQVPKGLRPILEKALAVSIQERYPDAIKFISDLSEYLKSGGLEKDRPGTDQLKEILETIQKAGWALSPSTLPSWPSLEMGIAKYKAIAQESCYYDFFKFPDNTSILLIAQPLQNGLETPIFCANLRGMIRALLAVQENFSFPLFISALNRIVHEDPLGQKYAAAFLILSPSRDELSFLSCGLGNILHISPGHLTPHKLSNQNPPLGSPMRGDFELTVDNWNIGDILIFHSFDPSVDYTLQEALKESFFLSPQGKADALLKKVATLPLFAQDKKPQVLFSLHRIG
jgi:eukaryotic-like serine/threonine-protein kinase